MPYASCNITVGCLVAAWTVPFYKHMYSS
uniref:Uncharacterized protein n=1 Tax=Anguilla anguilla TaxID=7936 RepID=A0A0E9VG85_ANGAN